jgi:hypothetical protein
MLDYIVTLGPIATIIGGFAYIRDTIRGTTKPNRVTWLLWSVTPIIAMFAMLSSGVTWAALPVFFSGFVPLLVFLSSFVNKNSYWKTTYFDYICGGLSLMALVLWWLENNPVYAIIFSLLSSVLAIVPTIYKAYKYPESESCAAFIAGAFNGITALLVVHSWRFTECAFPLYLIINSTILSSVCYRTKLKILFRKK